MKHTLRNIGLLGLILSIFVIKSIVSAADPDLTIDPTYPQKVWYRSTLHTLNLGQLGQPTATLKQDNLKLKFTNGLVAGNGSNNINNSEYAVIGGGKGNTINNKNYAGIGGGESNTVNGKWAVIGGGNGNQAQGDNAVVVGGQSNEAAGGSVVVGGESNKGLNLGIVLGGFSNTGYKNSLVLGHNSTANEGSFVWNGDVDAGEGRVNAVNGVLVGTTTPINGVNLVVNGAVKVAGDKSSALKGEVRYVGGCFYAYDGVKWYVINRGNEESPVCVDGFDVDEVGQYCEFGNTVVWHLDEVVGYSSPYAVNSCGGVKKTLVCNNGNLYIKGTTTRADDYYPYCYTIHNN